MALTPEAIPTNEQLRESLADRVYHPHKKMIMLGGVIFLALIIGWLAVREVARARREDMWAQYQEAQNQFSPNPLVDVDAAAARKQIEMLDAVRRDYPNDPVTPFALLHKARAQFALAEYEAALTTLDDLRARFKDFPLNTLPADTDAAGRPRSLAQRLAELIQREKEWSTKRNYVHQWPSEDRMALIETTAGNMWLGFYSGANEAPQHVNAFVERAKRGDYNGTQAYLVVQSVDSSPERFECGSALSGIGSSAVKDPAEHDRDQPSDTIEPEDAINTIRHQFRVVSSVRMDSGESATRFQVVAKHAGLEKLDGQSTPFAAVMDREDSLATIEAIGKATTYGNHPATKDSSLAFRMRDYPYPPIYLRRVSIFSKEKLEEGHTWDTSRVGQKNTPEPWEADRKAPLPDDFK